jgi:phage terminase small subunit
MPTDTLTPKQEAFCRAMITEPDQSAAYRAAYNCQKATPKTINEMASKLLKNPKVAARVTALRAILADQAVMKEPEWRERLTKIARADVRNMFDTHGNPIEIPNLPENEAAAVAGFEFTEEYEGKGESRQAVGVTKKFKLVDPLRALEVLGKAYGFMSNDAGDKPPTTVNNLTLNQTNITVQPAEAYHQMIKGA